MGPFMYKQYFISYISNKDTRVKTVILLNKITKLKILYKAV